MLDIQDVRRLNERLSQPYELPADCPYLSEDQLELCRMTFAQRAEWMGEWLFMAQGTADDDDDEWREYDIALEPRYTEQLLDIIRRSMAGAHGEVLLFGSRARGNSRPASDIDLAVSTSMPAGALLSRLRESLEDSTIPFTADVVDLSSCGPALAAQVEREGVVVWKS
jgi:predicted nucleotidyltransferase